MQKVVSILKSMIQPEQKSQNEVTTQSRSVNCFFNERREYCTLKDYDICSKIALDINNELNIDSIMEGIPHVTSSLDIMEFENDLMDVISGLLLKLEEDKFVTPDEKVNELMKKLRDMKCLCALRFLFEDLQNKFSSQVLIDSLDALSEPNLFNDYSKECSLRLELHLRTCMAVLERICFSSVVLSKDF